MQCPFYYDNKITVTCSLQVRSSFNAKNQDSKNVQEGRRQERFCMEQDYATVSSCPSRKQQHLKKNFAISNI